jgi:hypothetical protein
MCAKIVTAYAQSAMEFVPRMLSLFLVLKWGLIHFYAQQCKNWLVVG